ncbi:MAG: hypothetical protein ABIK09_15820 [Pseudomonadota bacterium]
MEAGTVGLGSEGLRERRRMIWAENSEGGGASFCFVLSAVGE